MKTFKGKKQTICALVTNEVLPLQAFELHDDSGLLAFSS